MLQEKITLTNGLRSEVVTISTETPIRKLAEYISRDWKKVNYAAKPYLTAMFSLTTVNERYGMDTGFSIVAYFLGNAGSYRGENAKAIKKVLNSMLK